MCNEREAASESPGYEGAAFATPSFATTSGDPVWGKMGQWMNYCQPTGTEIASGWTSGWPGPVNENMMQEPEPEPPLRGLLTIYQNVGQLPPDKAEALVERIREQNQSMLSRLERAGIEVLMIPVRNADTRVEYTPL